MIECCFRVRVEVMGVIVDLGNLSPPEKHKRLFASLSSHLRFSGLWSYVFLISLKRLRVMSNSIVESRGQVVFFVKLHV